jgi:trimeric autotransporter adhesin
MPVQVLALHIQVATERGINLPPLPKNVQQMLADSASSPKYGATSAPLLKASADSSADGEVVGAMATPVFSEPAGTPVVTGGSSMRLLPVADAESSAAAAPDTPALTDMGGDTGNEVGNTLVLTDTPSEVQHSVQPPSFTVSTASAAPSNSAILSAERSGSLSTAAAVPADSVPEDDTAASAVTTRTHINELAGGLLGHGSSGKDDQAAISPVTAHRARGVNSRPTSVSSAASGGKRARPLSTSVAAPVPPTRSTLRLTGRERASNAARALFGRASAMATDLRSRARPRSLMPATPPHRSAKQPRNSHATVPTPNRNASPARPATVHAGSPRTPLPKSGLPPWNSPAAAGHSPERRATSLKLLVHRFGVPGQHRARGLKSAPTATTHPTPTRGPQGPSLGRPVDSPANSSTLDSSCLVAPEPPGSTPESSVASGQRRRAAATSVHEDLTRKADEMNRFRRLTHRSPTAVDKSRRRTSLSRIFGGHEPDPVSAPNPTPPHTLNNTLLAPPSAGPPASGPTSDADVPRAATAPLSSISPDPDDPGHAHDSAPPNDPSRAPSTGATPRRRAYRSSPRSTGSTNSFASTGGRTQLIDLFSTPGVYSDSLYPPACSTTPSERLLTSVASRAAGAPPARRGRLRAALRKVATAVGWEASSLRRRRHSPPGEGHAAGVVVRSSDLCTLSNTSSAPQPKRPSEQLSSTEAAPPVLSAPQIGPRAAPEDSDSEPRSAAGSASSGCGDLLIAVGGDSIIAPTAAEAEAAGLLSENLGPWAQPPSPVSHPSSDIVQPQLPVSEGARFGDGIPATPDNPPAPARDAPLSTIVRVTLLDSPKPCSAEDPAPPEHHRQLFDELDDLPAHAGSTLPAPESPVVAAFAAALNDDAATQRLGLYALGEGSPCSGLARNAAQPADTPVKFDSMILVTVGSEISDILNVAGTSDPSLLSLDGGGEGPQVDVTSAAESTVRSAQPEKGSETATPPLSPEDGEHVQRLSGSSSMSSMSSISPRSGGCSGESDACKAVPPAPKPQAVLPPQLHPLAHGAPPKSAVPPFAAPVLAGWAVPSLPLRNSPPATLAERPPNGVTSNSNSLCDTDSQIDLEAALAGPAPPGTGLRTDGSRVEDTPRLFNPGLISALPQELHERASQTDDLPASLSETVSQCDLGVTLCESESQSAVSVGLCETMSQIDAALALCDVGSQCDVNAEPNPGPYRTGAPPISSATTTGMLTLEDAVAQTLELLQERRYDEAQALLSCAQHLPSMQSLPWTAAAPPVASVAGAGALPAPPQRLGHPAVPRLAIGRKGWRERELLEEAVVEARPQGDSAVVHRSCHEEAATGVRTRLSESTAAGEPAGAGTSSTHVSSVAQDSEGTALKEGQARSAGGSSTTEETNDDLIAAAGNPSLGLHNGAAVEVPGGDCLSAGTQSIDHLLSSDLLRAADAPSAGGSTQFSAAAAASAAPTTAAASPRVEPTTAAEATIAETTISAAGPSVDPKTAGEATFEEPTTAAVTPRIEPPAKGLAVKAVASAHSASAAGATATTEATAADVAGLSPPTAAGGLILQPGRAAYRAGDVSNVAPAAHEGTGSKEAAMDTPNETVCGGARSAVPVARSATSPLSAGAPSAEPSLAADAPDLPRMDITSLDTPTVSQASGLILASTTAKDAPPNKPHPAVVDVPDLPLVEMGELCLLVSPEASSTSLRDSGVSVKEAPVDVELPLKRACGSPREEMAGALKPRAKANGPRQAKCQVEAPVALLAVSETVVVPVHAVADITAPPELLLQAAVAGGTGLQANESKDSKARVLLAANVSTGILPAAPGSKTRGDTKLDALPLPSMGDALRPDPLGEGGVLVGEAGGGCEPSSVHAYLTADLAEGAHEDRPLDGSCITELVAVDCAQVSSGAADKTGRGALAVRADEASTFHNSFQDARGVHSPDISVKEAQSGVSTNDAAVHSMRDSASTGRGGAGCGGGGGDGGNLGGVAGEGPQRAPCGRSPTCNGSILSTGDDCVIGVLDERCLQHPATPVLMGGGLNAGSDGGKFVSTVGENSSLLAAAHQPRPRSEEPTFSAAVSSDGAESWTSVPADVARPLGGGAAPAPWHGDASNTAALLEPAPVTPEALPAPAAAASDRASPGSAGSPSQRAGIQIGDAVELGSSVACVTYIGEMEEGGQEFLGLVLETPWTQCKAATPWIMFGKCPRSPECELWVPSARLLDQQPTQEWHAQEAGAAG